MEVAPNAPLRLVDLLLSFAADAPQMMRISVLGHFAPPTKYLRVEERETALLREFEVAGGSWFLTIPACRREPSAANGSLGATQQPSSPQP